MILQNTNKTFTDFRATPRRRLKYLDKLGFKFGHTVTGKTGCYAFYGDVAGYRFRAEVALDWNGGIYLLDNNNRTLCFLNFTQFQDIVESAKYPFKALVYYEEQSRWNKNTWWNQVDSIGGDSVKELVTRVADSIRKMNNSTNKIFTSATICRDPFLVEDTSILELDKNLVKTTP